MDSVHSFVFKVVNMILFKLTWRKLTFMGKYELESDRIINERKHNQGNRVDKKSARSVVAN